MPTSTCSRAVSDDSVVATIGSGLGGDADESIITIFGVGADKSRAVYSLPKKTAVTAVLNSRSLFSTAILTDRGDIGRPVLKTGRRSITNRMSVSEGTNRPRYLESGRGVVIAERSCRFRRQSDDRVLIPAIPAG